MARFRWVKNSVFKTQFIRGSGSWGEPTPIENQSSLNRDALTYLTAPIEMTLSGETVSWPLTMAWTTI